MINHAIDATVYIAGILFIAGLAATGAYRLWIRGEFWLADLVSRKSNTLPETNPMFCDPKYAEIQHNIGVAEDRHLKRSDLRKDLEARVNELLGGKGS